MPVTYPICLPTEEQQRLKHIVQANKVAQHKRTHAHQEQELGLIIRKQSRSQTLVLR